MGVLTHGFFNIFDAVLVLLKHHWPKPCISSERYYRTPAADQNLPSTARFDRAVRHSLISESDMRCDPIGFRENCE
jgi:hypothetical protein